MSKGLIYLIQPAELVETDRYKIGMSNNPNLDRCKNGYKNGSRYLCIMECDEPLILESNIKKQFNKKFKLIAGNEYYGGVEKDILNTFNNLVMEHINSSVINKKIDKFDCKNLDKNLDIINSSIIVNNYQNVEIISKSILIVKNEEKIYSKYDVIKDFFEKLLYGGDFTNIKTWRTKCTWKYYDDVINELCEEIDEYKIREYLISYKYIIIQIFNKNFDEDDTEFKFHCCHKSFCEFLGYYDNNYSFLTSEYVKEVIEYNRANYLYYEIIKESNNKYSGIILYTKCTPEFISNVDLDYELINNNYGNFYANCQRYTNGNDFIQEHLEGHLDKWTFNCISYNSLYTRFDAEFKEIIYPHIILLSIKNEFSEKIVLEIKNNKDIMDKYKDKKVMKELKKYNNLKKYLQ